MATETFDNSSLNWTALSRSCTVLITQMDVLPDLRTAQLSLVRWALALAPAVALFFLWDLGKLAARRSRS